MRMKRIVQRYLLLFTISAPATSVFGLGTEIKNIDAVANENEVRIEVELTAPVIPTVRPLDKPSRLIVDFPNVSDQQPLQQLNVNKDGVKTVNVAVHSGVAHNTRVVVELDSLRPFGIETTGNKVVLRVLAVHGNASTPAARPTTVDSIKAPTAPESAIATLAAPPSVLPETQGVQLEPALESTSAPTVEQPPPSTAPIRRSFKVKYISGNTVYIDGGSNAGLREGMHLDIRNAHVSAENAIGNNNLGSIVASLRIVGVATTSAITEIGNADGEFHLGDIASLTPGDDAAAAENAVTAASDSSRAASSPHRQESEPSGQVKTIARNSLRSTATSEPDGRSRMAGRFSFDYSGITSSGSTPGASTQVGMSFQSDMTHILGTHWNLEGYWRGRINRHSQFKEATIDDTLNKTYTMQLYYDNPNSKWVAGVGRLYLPWAVSLDTIDGGYFGRKAALGMTAGVFAGSTPDLSSWNYQPDHRIAGSFVNFEGGDHDRFHYTSTTGLALGTIGWKLDRPYAFFENEASYKGIVSAYNSLIADSPRGVSTNGIRPGAGVSHSYSTVHVQPSRIVSFDLYHNFFRDVPTAKTEILGTGLVDKLLFQGISAGTRVKPLRNVTLYTTLGASQKTGDAHRSLNQMYGATWSEIARTGLRADYHYSKFDSNFAKGDYNVLSLSRQLTNRMFWNVQLGKQNIASQVTDNYDSKFIADSMDINMGKHSYLQSGYTYVNGTCLNYRQWYLSWGYRFDKGRDNPEFVQSLH
jgi:hypothetical protein